MDLALSLAIGRAFRKSWRRNDRPPVHRAARAPAYARELDPSGSAAGPVVPSRLGPGGLHRIGAPLVTKRRPALSFHLALTKIAGVLGWDRAAAIVGQAERTVRNWSDPDTSSSITIDAALALDVAYRAAGGDGAPMFQCYSTRLEVDTQEALFSTDAIARAASALAKESGEAVSAAIDASRPGASPLQLARAELEIEEMVAAGTATLAQIRAGRPGPEERGD